MFYRLDTFQCHGVTVSHNKQGLALTRRNRTGPPCSVGRPNFTRPAAGDWRPARPIAVSVTDDDDRRQTTTEASQQNNTGPLGGLVIKKPAQYFFSIFVREFLDKSPGRKPFRFRRFDQNFIFRTLQFRLIVLLVRE